MNLIGHEMQISAAPPPPPPMYLKMNACDNSVPFCLSFSGLALVELFQSSHPSPFILQQKEKLQQELEEMLGTDGVLLYPSHPQIAPKHHHPVFTPFNFSYTGKCCWVLLMIYLKWSSGSKWLCSLQVSLISWVCQ